MAAEAPIYKKHYSFEEYLKLEELEDIRYEYYDGEVFVMAGGSMNHSNIAYNINRSLNDALENSSCFSFQADVKVELGKSKAYFYPDVVLTCDAEDIKGGNLVRNPSLIAEVLSPSTESYDRGTKSILYRRLPSLRYYLLISQSEPLVQIYSRNSAITLFQVQDFTNMDDIITFPELGFSLDMQHIYRRIVFA